MRKLKSSNIHTSSKKEFCKISDEAIWESRFICCFSIGSILLRFRSPIMYYVTSSECLTNSACTSHFLLHGQLCKWSYHAKLIITTDREKSSERIYLGIGPFFWYDKTNKKYQLTTRALVTLAY